MKTFEIQTPDGRTFEVQAPDLESAVEAAQSFAAPQQAPAPPSNTVDDFMAGTGAFADEGGAAPAPYEPPATGAQRAGRALQVGAQGVGSGLAAIPSMPFDLAGGIVDMGLGAAEWGANRFLDEPVELPRVGAMPLGHEHLTTSAGNIMEALGFPPIGREDMSENERLVYDVNRFGTEGAVIGTSLNRLANSRYPQGTMQGQTAKPGDAFVRPYVGRGGRPVIGDTAAGAGAGVGYNFANENFPDNPNAELLGLLAGGIGGAMISETPAAALRAGRSVIERNTPSRNIPMDESGIPVSRRVERRAGEMAQQMADDPAQAAETIARRANEGAGGPTATTGLLSGDVGLTSAEQAVRMRDRAPFIQRDQQVAQRASDDISSLQDPNADQTFVTREAAAERDRQLGPFRQQESAADVAFRSAEDFRRQQGTPLQGVANEQARTSASSELFDAIEGPYRDARSAKNQAFDTIDPNRTQQVDASDVIGIAQRIRADINELAPSGLQVPGEFVQALERLAPDMQSLPSSVLDASGNPIMRDVNVGGPGTAALGDLIEVRKYLATAQENARRSGNFTLADNLAELRRTINETVERSPAAAAANDQYRTFADRYRPSPADEGARFTREIDRGRDPLPSRTASRFLSAPEKTAALRRMTQGADTAPVRDYMRSDFASSILKDGVVDPARADAWLRNNADTLELYPELRNEFSGIAQQARRGETMSQQAQQQLKEAAGNAQAAERAFERSVLGDLARTDPRNVAQRLMAGGNYGSDGDFREITRALRGNPEALRGWRSAVAEVMSDKVRNTGGDLAREGAEGPVSIAKMRRVYNQHQDALREVFSPDDMATLNRAHELLSPMENRRLQATAGSPTAENAMLTGAWDALGTALTFRYGAVHAGMVMHRLKRMMNHVPGIRDHTLDNQALAVVNRMWFDPDLARHLLEADVSTIQGPGWNKRLNQLIGTTEYLRAEPQEEPDELMDAIGEPERQPLMIDVGPRHVR